MILIGLTGGIASGKSAASDHFKHLGAAVLSADVLARKVVSAGSEGLAALVKEFGKAILLDNGELDRQSLRERIFSSADARETVDSLLHPRIRALSEQHINKAAEQQHNYLVYEVPLLIETDQVDRFDRIAVVDVPTQMQIDRLLQRDGTTKEQALSILAAQASREQRLAIADDVIDNSGTLEELHKQIAALHLSYTKLATSRSTTG
jgi:dephospho-CoA kinase